MIRRSTGRDRRVHGRGVAGLRHGSTPESKDTVTMCVLTFEERENDSKELRQDGFFVKWRTKMILATTAFLKRSTM